MKQKNYFLIDEDGEIVQEMGSDLSRLLGKDILIRSNVPLRKTLKFDYKFVKLNYKAVYKIYKECPQIIILLEYAHFKDNVLTYPNGVYVTPTNLAKKLGYSEDYMRSVFKKLKELKAIDVIRERNRNVYVLNPYIAIKGNEIYEDIAVKFERTEWCKLVEERGKRNDL